MELRPIGFDELPYGAGVSRPAVVLRSVNRFFTIEFHGDELTITPLCHLNQDDSIQ